MKGLDINTELELADLDSLDSGNSWEESQIASFIKDDRNGRIFCVGAPWSEVAGQLLKDAGYQVDTVDGQGSCEELIEKVQQFGADLIYLTLDSRPEALNQLEFLAKDPRTKGMPLIALLHGEIDNFLVLEAYRRSACDFLRIDGTEAALLGRTNMIVRLIQRGKGGPAANQATTLTNDKKDEILLHDDSGLLCSPNYFYFRYPAEVSRARRHERPLSMVALHCPEAERNSKTTYHLSKLLSTLVRDSDVASRIRPEMFVLLLPETSSDSLDALERRLVAEIRKLGIHCGFGRAGMEGHFRASSPRDLLDRACAVAAQNFGSNPV